MRSQLFGFTAPIHFVYEANLTCPLAQAHEITYQIIQQTAAWLRRVRN